MQRNGDGTVGGPPCAGMHPTGPPTPLTSLTMCVSVGVFISEVFSESMWAVSAL